MPIGGDILRFHPGRAVLLPTSVVKLRCNETRPTSTHRLWCHCQCLCLQHNPDTGGLIELRAPANSYLTSVRPHPEHLMATRRGCLVMLIKAYESAYFQVVYRFHRAWGCCSPRSGSAGCLVFRLIGLMISWSKIEAPKERGGGGTTGKCSYIDKD